MNSLILLNNDGLVTDPKIVTHLHETLGAKVGDQLKCTVLNHAHALGTILELTENSCQLKLESFTAFTPAWFNLVVGVSRPQTTRKILEHATTFGAKKIHFYKAALSEKSYLSSKVFEEKEKNELLLAGLSQSACYGQLPEVSLDKYNPANQYATESQKFVLDLTGAKSFLDYHQEAKINFESPITLAIGPERGFIQEDLEHFKSAGFKSVKISPSVLRVEHAIYSAISQLELLKGKF